MSVHVKICGITTRAVLEAALAADVDMVGFVFVPQSSRYLPLEEARALARIVEGRCQIVALTLDAQDAQLDSIMRDLAPDYLQLHGHETVDRVHAVRQRFGCKVIKALPVAEPSDLDAVPLYEKAADCLLFDAKPAKNALLPGGNGLSFDWRLLDGLSERLPYLLSGGLTVENVAKALAMTGAWGVDVSSGVETAPGQKDPLLVQRFIEAARAARP